MNEAQAWQKLIDRQEIHDLLLTYCRGVDRLDADLVNSIFHDDAKVEYSTFTAIGRDIADQALGISGNRAQHKMAMHHITNHLVHLDGDLANAETYFVTWTLSEEESPERLEERSGRYLDRFERREGIWRISERVIIWDWRRSMDMPVPFREIAGKTIGFRSEEDASYHFLTKQS